MKLWRISQTANDGYDTYDSAVVAADTEEAARNTTPEGSPFTDKWSTWCASPDQVTVELIGEAKPGTVAGVILASFNAG